MIEEYLSPYEFTSKQELMAKTGLDERTVRAKVSELKLTKAVLYNSQTKGHRLRKNKEQLEELTADEIMEEMKLNDHARKDILSRIKALSDEMTPYDKYNEELELIYLRKCNEEFYSKNKVV